MTDNVQNQEQEEEQEEKQEQEQVLLHMQTYGFITPYSAWTEYGCLDYRLEEIISELEKSYEIKTSLTEEMFYIYYMKREDYKRDYDDALNPMAIWWDSLRFLKEKANVK